jgi:serine/threonine-protein kinase
VRQAGQLLNVSTLVQGRIALHSDAIEVSVRLDDTADGSTIWERVYRTMSSNVQGLQHDMTFDLSRELRLRPTADEQRRLTARSTDSADAYRLYLKGRYQSNRLTVDGLKRGIDFMNQAIAADPTYALAYSGLADAYADAAGVYLTSAEALPRVRAAAERALTLEPSLVEARSLLAYVEGLYTTLSIAAAMSVCPHWTGRPIASCVASYFLVKK